MPYFDFALVDHLCALEGGGERAALSGFLAAAEFTRVSGRRRARLDWCTKVLERMSPQRRIIGLIGGVGSAV